MTRQVPRIIILTKSSRGATNPTITSATDNNHYSLYAQQTSQSISTIRCRVLRW